MKFISFVIMLIVMSQEAKPKLLEEFPFLQNTVLNFFFPKNPSVVRVRSLEQARTANQGGILNFMGLVERHGYPAEEHDVTTADGYNLKIHRIPGSPLSNSNQTKKVVFLQHGIIASSDSWVLFGPGKDLTFLLADQGYDVWIGNIRGNAYCRSHVNMSSQDRDFWRFSYHEVGTEDLPAMIDYILDYTGQETLYYIGHSMGTITLFVLLSTRPEYNAKIELGVCLAPIAFWEESPPVVQYIMNYASNILEFFGTNDIYDLLPMSSPNIMARKLFCSEKGITQILCITIMFLLAGSDPIQLNTTALPEIFTYYPAGTSVQTLYHLYQNIVTNDFRSFDPGFIDNYRRYKSTTSTRYDLQKITTPLALFYGPSDPLATRRNVLEVYKQLPNVVLLEEIPYRLFTHIDFLWATDARTLLYDHLIEIMQEF